MTLWGTVTALEKLPSLGGATEVPLSVELPSSEVGAETLSEGIRSLYQKCQFYDIFLVSGGTRFPAHQVALASLSSTFRERVCEMRARLDAEAAEGRASEEQGGGAQETAAAAVPELHLQGISHPEAVRVLLDFTYGLGGGAYQVSSEEANIDVLRLANEFDITGLREHAAARLTEDLNTANLVQRLAVCKEFGLDDLYSKIVERLVSLPPALLEASQGEELLGNPEILQQVLMRAAARYHHLPMGEFAAASRKRRASAPAADDDAMEPKSAKLAHAAVSGGA